MILIDVRELLRDKPVDLGCTLSRIFNLSGVSIAISITLMIAITISDKGRCVSTDEPMKGGSESSLVEYH